MFPGEQPPTWFHPASPKDKSAQASQRVKDLDSASMVSKSTFSSTISLLKENVKSKLPSKSHKSHTTSTVSEKKSSPYAQTVRVGDVINGEDKTRTSTSIRERDEEKRETLKSFILLKGNEKEEKADSSIARQRTAEAYMIWAATK